MEWQDANAQAFGRTGQTQHGVDVYGQAPGGSGRYCAAQCKLKATGIQPTKKEIDDEVVAARDFPHKLEALIIATSAPRDTHTQILVDEVSARETKNNGFPVVLWSWNEIAERIAAYPPVIVRYYHDFVATLTGISDLEPLVSTPISACVLGSSSQAASTIISLLALRGVQCISTDTYPQTSRAGLTAVAPDALLAIHWPDELAPAGTNELLRLAGQLFAQIGAVELNTPVFVVIAPEQFSEFVEHFQKLGGNRQRLGVLSTQMSPGQVADHVFGQMFDFAYRRRGSLTTVDVAIHGEPGRPGTALLDMDWHNYATPTNLPSQQSWSEILWPAMLIVSEKLVSLGQGVRLQIRCSLPLPGAVALGFLLNLRVAQIGVWTRTMGASDFKQQFWHSDIAGIHSPCSINWVKQVAGYGSTAIVEFGSFGLHPTVAAFASALGIDPDAWLQVQIDASSRNMEEDYALGSANQLAQAIRELNAQGICDTHLFLRVPSALAVLIGQRLQACGRIHLYWYDNPTYKYAFTLK